MLYHFIASYDLKTDRVGAETLSLNRINVISVNFKTSNLPWQDNPVLPTGWTIAYDEFSHLNKLDVCGLFKTE